MSANLETYRQIKPGLDSSGVTLVAVSKLKTASDILALYNEGQRDFGENYVQELLEKQAALPADINWHFIGHLQSNKVKYIAPFVHLIHGVDSLKLLKEIDKQGLRHHRAIECLLQIHIASEETKFGMDQEELAIALKASTDMAGVKVRGLMGMASFSSDLKLVGGELENLKKMFDDAAHLADPDFNILSMGMSGDYDLAIEKGSTMVRIGSLLFGRRG